MLIDKHGRKITYLRVSVTDRCNLRCFYCSSKDAIAWLPHEEILSYEELLEIVKVAISLGIEKIRLTGGEPLVRKDFVSLVAAISKIPGLRDLSLTTNGILLAEFAEDLKKAGLNRINISLDTLDPKKYKTICGYNKLGDVLRGIDKALEMGFSPVKINTVVMKGLNEDEILDLAKLTIERPVEVRFIEFMPVGDGAAWEEKYFMPVAEIKKRVEMLGPLVPAQKIGAGPARVYTLPNACGKIGFISAITEHFCDKCNRLRLTPEGKLRMCLFSDEEIDLKPYLRGNFSRKDLKEAFLKAIKNKPAKRSLSFSPHRIMRSIGG
ncbi:GTP 3',8-cyclase MoaA [Thermodesulfatator atlanticus]|uniref:GTP 3',8-cyclase MoaA n=1 Tax=Thermodesulfatator atlanticus TaxID=501497 RepID=UPI0003B4AA85|nr:GTP 3',8-cyclase MoaA [Thermodesulfatator atlanticus]